MIEQANNTKVLFEKFAETLSDISQVDQAPKLDGYYMNMLLSPLTKTKKGNKGEN